MRRWSYAAAILLAAIVAVAGARAQASTLAFTGTLTLQLDDPFVPPFVIPGSGVASLTPGGGFHLSSFALAGGTFGPATFTTDHIEAGAGPVVFSEIENLSGAFTGTAGGPPAGGVMGLSGVAKLCFTFDLSCSVIFIDMPLGPTTGGAGFGIGGTVLVPNLVGVTLQHSPWAMDSPPTITIHDFGTVVRTLALPVGFAHGPASLTSSTAMPSGVLQLVTITKVYSEISEFPEIPLVGVLNLHFVPEPGTALLGAFGALALVASARRPGSK